MINSGSVAARSRAARANHRLILPLGLILIAAACTTTTPVTPPITVEPVSPAPAARPAAVPVTAPSTTSVTAPPSAAATAPVPTRTPATARPPAPPPLLGSVSRGELKTYASWTSLFTSAYSPDPSAVATIRANSDGVSVLLILGTWCGDSKREVPRYFAIMDEAGIGDATLTSVGVDRTKKDAGGLTEQHAITRVPTFVFFRHGREIGRVVEKVPAGSTLEAEIAKILSVK